MTIEKSRARALGFRSGLLSRIAGLLVMFVMYSLDYVFDSNDHFKIEGLAESLNSILVDEEMLRFTFLGIVAPLYMSWLLLGPWVGRLVLVKEHLAWFPCLLTALVDYFFIVLGLFFTGMFGELSTFSFWEDLLDALGMGLFGLFAAGIPILVVSGLRALWLAKQRERAEHVLW